MSYEFLCTNQKALLRAIGWYSTLHSSDQQSAFNFRNSDLGDFLVDIFSGTHCSYIQYCTIQYYT